MWGPRGRQDSLSLKGWPQESPVGEGPASGKGRNPSRTDPPQPIAGRPGPSQPGLYRAGLSPWPTCRHLPSSWEPAGPPSQPRLPAPSRLSWAWQGAVLASATPDKPQTLTLRAQTSLYKHAGCRKSLRVTEGEFAHVCHPLPDCQAVWVGKGLTVGPTAPGGPRSPLVPLAPARPWKPCQDAGVRACLQPPARPAPLPPALTPSWTTGLRPDQTLWFEPSLHRPVPPTSELVLALLCSSSTLGRPLPALPAGTDPALTPPGWVLGPPEGGVYGRELPGIQQRPT